MSNSILTKEQAYAFLELPVGADLDDIRTSYKRLSHKWYPEKKNPNYDIAMKNFQNVSQAFSRLATDGKRVIDLPEMYVLYQEIVAPQYRSADTADGYYFTDSDEDYDSSDEVEDENFMYMLGQGADKARYRRDYLGITDSDEDYDDNNLTAEERNKIANELISEEEKTKKKIEKRRLKKKQRREKKRLEKQNEQQKQLPQPTPTNEVKKGKNKNKETVTEKTIEKTDSEKNIEKTVSEKHIQKSVSEKNIEKSNSAAEKNYQSYDAAALVQSRQYAVQGNEKAISGSYLEAIKLFSSAIELDSSDYRFFGNRSFCYERLEEYDQALNDANVAISLSPDWPKGHFRRGKALAGLKDYISAEQSYLQVLKLEPTSEDAKFELNEIRITQIMDMGFNRSQAETAISQFKTVQHAIDSLLSNIVPESSMLDEVYVSDDEESKIINSIIQKSHSNGYKKSLPETVADNSWQKASVRSTGSPQPDSQAKTVAAPKRRNNKPAAIPPIPQHHYEESQRKIQMNKHVDDSRPRQDDAKTDPGNPLGLCSLWVGNVSPSVDAGTITEIFSKCGKLVGVRLISDKFCAFVNYTDKEYASNALKQLQGFELAGQNLFLKFPDKPVNIPMSQNKFDNLTNGLLKTRTLMLGPHTAEAATANKQQGPVNGDECYFWRTTGCQFASSCRYRHVPDHKGVDRKPWQQNSSK